MAIFDPFRKAMGISTQSEIADARKENGRISTSDAPRDQFATAVADAVSSMETSSAVRAFPALDKVPLKGDEHVRWATVAKAAHALADESVARPVQSLDAPLSRAVGERALVEASGTIRDVARQRDPSNQRVDSILDGKRDLVSTQTRAFMSEGPAAEMNARTQANDMFYNGDQAASHKLHRDVGDVVGRPTAATRKDWLLDAARARLAAAQVGALPAGRTVEAAMEASTQGHMVQGAIAQTPNRARDQLIQGADRVKLIQDKVARNMAPPQTLRQHMVERGRDVAREGILATATGGPGKADRAAAAQSLSGEAMRR